MKLSNNLPRLNSNHVLWALYIALLSVLLPHTAWTFSQFESQKLGLAGLPWGQVIAWVAAFAFEAAIAVFTHGLKQHNQKVPRYSSGWVSGRKLAYRYLNPFALALTIALSYSGLANFTHAVEFGRTLKVFTVYNLPPWLYSVTFGAILPLCSLVFALVLSSTTNTESDRDEELLAAKAKERAANRELVNVRQQLEEANVRFAAAGDLFARLFAEEKRERILFAHQQWPQLSNSAISVITESSPAHVSEVLKER